MRISKSVLGAGLMALLSQGCAHNGAQERLDTKLAHQSAIASPHQLHEETRSWIDEATDLTPEQKTALHSLHAETSAQVKAIEREALKLRALLVQDLLSPEYDRNEVGLIEKRLKDLQSQRLSTTFNAIEKVNATLGRQARAHEREMHEYLLPHEGRIP